MMNRSVHPMYSSFPPLIQPVPHGHERDAEDTPDVIDLRVRKPTSTPTPYQIDPRPVNAISPMSEVSVSSSMSNNSTSKLKPVRPFKAYPSNLSMALVDSVAGAVETDSSKAFEEFRNNILSQCQISQNRTNKNMRRNQTARHISDPIYWEKRKKNNEAAKRSRDARRAKEDEIAIRCAFLERDNARLRYRLSVLELELQRMFHG